MRYVTREEMQEIDRRAIREYGIPVETLMENAGRAVADAALTLARAGTQLVVVCGAGNNGGDGLVAARYLSEKFFTWVVLLERASDVDPNSPCGKNLGRIREGAAHADRVSFEDATGDLHALFYRFYEVEVPKLIVIDALFGTGLTRPVEGRYAEMIRRIEEFWRAKGAKVIAVDVPSGLDANTGRPLGGSVRATKTVTLGLPKVGFRASGAAEYTGEVVVADIGFPKTLLE